MCIASVCVLIVAVHILYLASEVDRCLGVHTNWFWLRCYGEWVEPPSACWMGLLTGLFCSYDIVCSGDNVALLLTV